MRNTGNFATYAACVALLLTALGAGAASNLRPPGKIGVYCTLRDIQDAAAMRQAMQQMKAAGIDFILPGAKGTSGKVQWDSQVAPKDMLGNTQSMGLVLQEAHRVGLKVYPVVCVATEGGEGKANALLERNPAWAQVINGERYGFIDPGNAAARKYETDLIAELVGKYPVDGLSLDYMRGPNRVGYTETGRAEFLKRRNVDLAQLTTGPKAQLDTEGGKEQARKAAATARQHPVWPEWREWRRRQLNGFMREIHAAVEQARPGLPISSYCWGARTYTGNYETCQDWKTWIQEGWLDWINPSGYRYTDQEFREAATSNRAAVPKGFPFYITIGVATSHGKLPDVPTLRRQMAMSKEAGADGLIFFTWEALRKFLPDAARDIQQW